MRFWIAGPAATLAQPTQWVVPTVSVTATLVVAVSAEALVAPQAAGPLPVAALLEEATSELVGVVALVAVGPWAEAALLVVALSEAAT